MTNRSKFRVGKRRAHFAIGAWR